jgi:hypothetical protein
LLDETALKTLSSALSAAERDLGGVDVALGHRRLSMAGASLHVDGRVAGRRVVRERGVPEVVPRPDRPLDLGGRREAGP